MKERFQYILDNYNEDKNFKVDSTSDVYNELCRALPNEIRTMLDNDDLIVKGSMGQGNKTEYPWLSILNRNITRTTQKGLYIVYLFKKDMSGFYLTLIQGITHFEIFRKDRYKNARKVSEYFRSQIEQTSFSDENIDLGGTKRGELGYGYEQATVLSKYYPTNKINEEILYADLVELLQTYEFMAKHMEPQNYDEIIKYVLADDDPGFLSGDEAIDEIDREIDPEDGLPHDVKRKLEEKKPYVDLSKKFKKITSPKLTKIDYIKKAVKDLKIGLRGEKLVIAHEQDRLRELGFYDEAENVEWVSKEDDTLGYDVRSFDIDQEGNLFPIQIEVKTTRSIVDTEFFVTKNELNKSKELAQSYFIYRVYDADSQRPKFYRAQGKIEDNFIIDPYTFTARYKYPEVIESGR